MCIPKVIAALAFGLACLVNFGHAESNSNQLTEAEKRSGWELLFDGQSMDAWRNYQAKEVSDGWKVEGDAIVRSGRKAGDIITKKQYEHFELKLEYRVSKKGNSGLMFHVTEEGKKPYHTGPEIQIQDNIDGTDQQKSGWLYQLYKPTNPKWQLRYEKSHESECTGSIGRHTAAGRVESHVRTRRQYGEVVVNGWHYYNFRKGSAEWDRRVGDSKFKKWEAFGKPTKGHICLQDHGNVVAFRNIKIREISADGYKGQPVDGKLSFKGVPAFPKIQWEGWESAEETGKYRPTRPMTVTHAADGSNRLLWRCNRVRSTPLKTIRRPKLENCFLTCEKR